MKINNLLESANPWQSVQNEATRLAGKWNRSGLLKGLSNEVDKNNMSIMLENQAKQLVVESSLSGGGVAGGSFTPGTGEQWAGVALPLVRKIFGQIASKEFVSTQPMNLPAGLVFFLDFQYGTSKNPFTSGESMYGVTSASAEPNGGLYGAGRFGYTINTTASVVTATTGSATWATFGLDANYSASATQYKTITVTLPTAADFYAARSFTLISGSITSANNLPTFTSFNNVSNTVTFVVTGSLVNQASMANTTVSFSIQPKDNARGDFEDGNTTANASNGSISIPEVNVSLRSEAIVAKTRKLKAHN